jgi:hypothetical protein
MMNAERSMSFPDSSFRIFHFSDGQAPGKASHSSFLIAHPALT